MDDDLIFHRYTRGELSQLCQLFKQQDLLIGIFLKKNDATDKWHLKTDEELYETMVTPSLGGTYGPIDYPKGNNKLKWSAHYNRVRDLMFKKRLDDMPLYVNDSILSIVANWRMRLAK